MEPRFKEMVPEIRKLAAQKEIKDLNFTTRLLYTNMRGEASESPSKITISGTYPTGKSKEKDEFSTAVATMCEEKKVEPIMQLLQQDKGAPFPPIKKAMPVLKQVKGGIDVAPIVGEVTIFEFWGTCCPCCEEDLTKHQQMLKQRPEWAKKVRIVAVSIDKTIDISRKRIQEHDWKKIDHYWVPGQWDAAICQTLQISGLPFGVLVDTKGIIRLVGDPANMALKINIPLLLSGKTQLVEKKFDLDESMTVKSKAYTYEECKKDIESFIADNALDIKKVFNFEVLGAFEKEFKEHDFEIVDTSLNVNFEWPAKHPDLCTKLKGNLNSLFAAKIEMKIEDRKIIQGQIKRGVECSKCCASLASDDQYCCTICKPPKYFCPKCINSIPSPSKSSELLHEHGLYLIQKDTTTSLDEVRFFNFAMIKKEAMERTHEQARCDLCTKIPVGICWKCAVCANIDICEACFRIAQTPTDAKYSEIVEKAKGFNHDLREHIYIRMEFEYWINLYPEY